MKKFIENLLLILLIIICILQTIELRKLRLQTIELRKLRLDIESITEKGKL